MICSLEMLILQRRFLNRITMAKEVKSVDYGLEKIFEGAQDFLPLLGTDYVGWC